MNTRLIAGALARPALALAAAAALLLGTGAPGSAAETESPAPAPAAKPVPRPGADPEAVAPLGVNAFGWLKNHNSGRCLAVPGGSHQPAEGLIQWGCGSWADHYWDIRYEGDGDGERWYSVRNMNSGMCLSVDAARTTDFARATQYPCGDANQALFVDQYWALRYNSAKQANQLVNWNSRKCLAVLDGNKNDGAAVIQYGCGGWNDHYWR
ncbi:RICIN domain-containing protein [Streptomyces sp. NPDC018338]|uniref:RICIN domain-containing protein n=1 Tax=Streptomyces sp. NPDC018338 TaxID=3157192 RepID=UPI0033F61091